MERDLELGSDVNYLFGGKKEWISEEWTASDDRVRGGKSQSYLKCSEDDPVAIFHGTLDIETLGGAGFASQRTTSVAGGPWDLSKASGLCIGVEHADERTYTIVVKNEILPKRPDGREQSTVSYEFSFSIVYQGSKILPSQEEQNPTKEETGAGPSILKSASAAADDAFTLPIVIFIPWDCLKPFYRGKKKPDAQRLDVKNIERLSIMCRSLFGAQCGDFSLGIRFLAALDPKTEESSGKGFITSPLSFKGYEDEPTDEPYFSYKIPVRAMEPLADGKDDSDWDLIEDLEELNIKDGEAKKKRTIDVQL